MDTNARRNGSSWVWEDRGGFLQAGQLHLVICTFRPKFWDSASLVDGCVKNCPRKNVVKFLSIINISWPKLYQSVIWIWSLIRIWNRNCFGHDRLKIDQDLPYFHADNSSRDPRTLDEIYIEQSVIASFRRPILLHAEDPNEKFPAYIDVDEKFRQENMFWKKSGKRNVNSLKKKV